MELQTKIAMITEDKVTEIFCMANDFCKFFWCDDGKMVHQKFGVINRNGLVHMAFSDGKLVYADAVHSLKAGRSIAILKMMVWALYSSCRHLWGYNPHKHDIENSSP